MEEIGFPPDIAVTFQVQCLPRLTLMAEAIMRWPADDALGVNAWCGNRDVASMWLLSMAGHDRIPMPLQQNGVTGGDLMDLEDDDLTSDLGLSRLQVPCSCHHPPPSRIAVRTAQHPCSTAWCRELDTCPGRPCVETAVAEADPACMRRQAKKVRGVQTAFRLFNRIMRVPGKGELTMVELRVRGHALVALKSFTVRKIAVCVSPSVAQSSCCTVGAQYCV